MYTPDSFVSGHGKALADARDALWFVVQDGRLLVTEGDAPALPDSVAALSWVPPAQAHFLGCLGSRDCFALHVEPGVDAPPGYRWAGLRSLFFVLPDDLLAVAGRAAQIVEWDRSHRYCGRCGTPTQQKQEERVKVCPACGHTAYPRVAPAMMVLIRRGRELLLARSTRFPNSMYSALAGFVEPGESIENTIHREVQEEVGLRVKDLRYFASQPWPFPHQLMVAFHAEYAGGEVTPDLDEIVDAQWFTLDGLPQLPGRMSISRHLIDAAVAELRQSVA
jgi:NAD+ diphosphatase